MLWMLLCLQTKWFSRHSNSSPKKLNVWQLNKRVIMHGEAAKQEDRECCSNKACGSTWSFPRDNLACNAFDF